MLVEGMPRALGGIGLATIGALLVFRGSRACTPTRAAGRAGRDPRRRLHLLLVLFPLPLPLFATLGLSTMFARSGRADPRRPPPATPTPIDCKTGE